MTRNRAERDGTPTPLMAEYYAQRATAGMIIAEASTPSAVGRTYPNITALYTDDHLAGWRQVTKAVQAAGGGPMFLQIQHGGRVGHPDTSGLTPIAPSPIPLPDQIHTPTGPQTAVIPREMTAGDIQQTIRDFAATARRAVDAGFAGVEVHSANGYLLHQFLAPNTNHRTDAYGGSITNRIRFTIEVVDAVTDGHRVTPHRPAHLPGKHRQRHHRHRRRHPLPRPHRGQRHHEPRLPAHRPRPPLPRQPRHRPTDPDWRPHQRRPRPVRHVHRRPHRLHRRRADDSMDYTASVVTEVAARLARGEGKPGAYSPAAAFGPEIVTAAGGTFVLD